MKSEFDAVMIDMSFINAGEVVLCKTYEEASEFIRAVLDKIPSLSGNLVPKLKRWNVESDHEGLAFRIEKVGKNIYDTGYCKADWYRKHNYKVVDYQSLIIGRDFGEISSGFSDSQSALAALF